jgi:hypothetical protein
VAKPYGARDQRGVAVHQESLVAKELIWCQVDFIVPLFPEYLRENHPLAAFEEA